MQDRKSIQSDHAIEFAKCFFRRRLAADVITGLEDMGGIETDTKPLRLAHVLDDRREMFELVAEARALAGGGLERYLRFHFRNHGPDRIQRRDDFFQTRLLARAEMRTGMHNEKRQLELIGAHQFLRERAERVRVELRIRRREIDEVMRVGESR